MKPLEATDSPQQEEDSDDDVSVIESLPLTPMQAIEAVKVIQDFVITLEESGERERNFLSSLSAMEDAFLRLQITTEANKAMNIEQVETRELNSISQCLSLSFSLKLTLRFMSCSVLYFDNKQLVSCTNCFDIF